RGDVFLPVVTPIDPGPVSAVIEPGYRALSPTWDAATERTIFGLLIEILRNRGGVELDAHAIVPTVAEARADSRARIYEISTYDPDYPVYRYNDVVWYRHRLPGRTRVHERRPRSQRGLLLVADDRPRHHREDRHRAANLHRHGAGGAVSEGGSAGPREVRPPAGRVRRGALLLVYEHEGDAV